MACWRGVYGGGCYAGVDADDAEVLGAAAGLGEVSEYCEVVGRYRGEAGLSACCEFFFRFSFHDV